MGCRCQAALLAVQAGQIYLDGVKVWQGMFFSPFANGEESLAPRDGQSEGLNRYNY